MGPGGSDKCAWPMANFKELTHELGVPLSEEKTEAPERCFSFWGIQIDTRRELYHFPEEKLERIVERIM